MGDDDYLRTIDSQDCTSPRAFGNQVARTGQSLSISRLFFSPAVEYFRHFLWFLPGPHCDAPLLFIISLCEDGESIWKIVLLLLLAVVAAPSIALL
jgi:hypothetical protein